MSLFNRHKHTPDPVSAAEKPVRVELANEKASQPVKGDREKSRGTIYGARVLLHPLMTEKSTNLTSMNQYSFAVGGTANKIMVKKAITEVYGLAPEKVRIINIVGKHLRSGRGRIVSRKDWKKAVITLPAGKNIDIYER